VPTPQARKSPWAEHQLRGAVRPPPRNGERCAWTC